MPTLSVIPVMYRDGSNNKIHDEYLLAGAATAEQVQAIADALDYSIDDEEGQFIPTQVGQSHLLSEHGTWIAHEDDHIWHVLYVQEYGTRDVETIPDGTRTIEDFTAAMVKAAADGWDDSVTYGDLYL